MRESEPWETKTYYLPFASQPQSSSKVPGQLALPFEPSVYRKDDSGSCSKTRESARTLYTPIVVVWAWISQVLDSDKFKQCRVSHRLVKAGAEDCSLSERGACSKARRNAYHWRCQPDWNEPLMPLPEWSRATVNGRRCEGIRWLLWRWWYLCQSKQSLRSTAINLRSGVAFPL